MEFDSVEKIERILSEIPSCIFFKDTECRYVFATHYWRHLNAGEDKDWSIKGKTDYDIRKDKANALKALEADRHIIETGESADYVIREETDGIVEYLQIMKRAVRDDDGKIIGIVGLINDITKQTLLEQQVDSYMKILKEESETDPLTQICNRRSGESLISKRNCKGLFCLFDVDKFKRINDTFGHGVGDEVLVGIAQTLKKSFRDSDIIMRLGGDEFAVFAAGIENAEVATCVLNRFFNELNKMHLESLGDYKVTVSMGVTFVNSDKDFDTMYKQADDAMYHRKKDRGGNGFDFAK